MSNTYTVMCQTGDEWEAGIEGAIASVSAIDEEEARTAAAVNWLQYEYFTVLDYKRPSGRVHKVKWKVTERIGLDMSREIVRKEYVVVRRAGRSSSKDLSSPE